MDLLVTGSAGFVGRWVALRARAAGMVVGECDWDLRDRELTARRLAAAVPRAVVHLAAAPRGDRWGALADDISMAGGLLAGLATHAAPAVVVIPGSAAQYGAGAPRPLRENDATDPISPYGAAKCALERAVTAAPLRGDVRVIWTRSFNHIGPGQGDDAPAAQWARQVAEAELAGGGTVRTGRLTVVRDFLDVRDVADAYLALTRSDAEGVVNVCSGVATPLLALAELFVAQARAAVSLQRDPALERAFDPPHVVGDPGLLRARTGWQPRVAIADSVAALLDEARARVAGGVAGATR